MAQFVLVHGVMHGAWCWDLLSDELAKLGHDSVAMDVPMDDLSAGMAEYVEAVASAPARWADRPIVVGHSMSGLIIPHVAAVMPVSMMVFLCGMVAPVTAKQRDEFSTLGNPEFASRLNFLPDGRGYCTPETAEWAFYHDVPDHLKKWATSRLVPFNLRIHQEMVLLDSFPAIPAQAIITTDDHMLSHVDALRRHCRERLGLAPLELPGSHSPFLSRPAALARMLDELAKVT